MIYENPKVLFKLETLSELPEDVILFLIGRDDFFIKEVQIWDQIIKWGILQNPHLDPDVTKWTKEDFETLKSRMQKFIPLIRFYQISFKEFKGKVVPYKTILPDNLYKSILKYHSRWLKFSFRDHARVKPIDSKIINYKNATILASWIDGKDKANDNTRPIMYEFYNNPYDFKLLYRGSRDGFSYGTLKKRCYYKGPTIIIAKIEGKQELIGGYNPIYWSTSELAYFSETKKGFIFSTKGGKDDFQERATVARMRFDYYSHFTAYRGYPYLSFGVNNLSFNERECHVRWSHGYYFTPQIKDQNDYSLDEFEVFAIIPKSRFKYWKNNLKFYSLYIFDMRFYEECFILLGKLMFLIILFLILYYYYFHN